MKTRVGIVFGGRSGEHEVSILSAASVLSAIDREKYAPVPFAIDKDGGWHCIDASLEGLADLSDARIKSLFTDSRRVTISDFDTMTDFAFPLLHGPYGEDGTIQGLFEILDKPYAGCGVAASAVSMDKIFMKELWGRAGLPQCKYTYTTRNLCHLPETFESELARIEREIEYPIFVKPANMGSSVGISKVKDRVELKDAIQNAFEYDKRIILEQTIIGREIEIGVLGNEEPGVSVVGEILPERDYYDYHSKYEGAGTKLVIPAELSEKVRSRIEGLARQAYTTLDAEGYARIDLFYNEAEDEVYLNELNAIPGFTRFSMFPLLWDARGVGYTELIERIIELGYERHNASYQG